MKSSLERKVSIAFALALASIAALGFLQYRTTRRLVEDNRLVSHSQEVLQQLARVRDRLNRADAAAQSYAITGNSADLATYGQSTAAIDKRFENLSRLIADNPTQQQTLGRLESLTDASFRVLQEEVNAGKAGPLSAERMLPLENAARKATDETRAAIADMQTEEGQLLRLRNEAAERSNGRTDLLILFGSGAAFALLCAAGILLYFGMAERRRSEKILRQSEERFRLLLNGMRDYAVFTLDPEGHISSWNTGAERITGYSASEILGRHISCFVTEEDLQAKRPQHTLEIAAREGRYEEEAWRVRKDGSRFWADVITNALKDDEGRLYGYSKVTRDFTDRMKAQEALRKANEDLQKEVAERRQAQLKQHESEESLRALSVRLLRMQDEERRRIGRELHDSVGQNLSVLKMGLDFLKSAAGTIGGAAAQRLDECVELASESIRDVRTMSYLLHPPMLEEMGLKFAISWYLEGFSKRSGIETTLDVSDEFGRLPAEAELAIFRVLQESLTNVHRHSGSLTACVRIGTNNGTITLEVEDRGKGMAPRKPDDDRQGSGGAFGVGLRGMSERMRQLKGELEVFSTGQGTTVRATLPRPESMSASVG
jgi:PAS domain S-box-containing protein